MTDRTDGRKTWQDQTGDLPRYIVVEGIIGAGKTTLAEMIAPRLGAEVLHERFEENPFLERYYLDPGRYAFQTQLFFLLNRYEQLSSLHQLDLFRSRIVSDFSFDKDPLFASVTLRPEERKMYEQIRSSLSEKIPSPDMVILLQTSPETALRRIAERGRAMEEPISREYLAGLAEAYNQRFIRNASTPTLIVDTDRFDLREEVTLADLMKYVERVDPEVPVQRFTPEGGAATAPENELGIPLEVVSGSAQAD